MRKQWYGKVAYVTALSLVLGSGVYFGIGVADDAPVVVSAADAASGDAASGSVADIVYDTPVELDGSWTWSENYTLHDGYVATVYFEYTPALIDYVVQENGKDVTKQKYSAFGIETIATDSVKGLTLVGDNRSWTYGNGSEIPTVAAQCSFNQFLDNVACEKVLKGKTVVSLRKTSDKVLEVNVQFADGVNTLKFTVTYKSIIPKDFKFHVGNTEAGKTVVSKVTYDKSATSTTPTQAPSASASANPSGSPAASGSPAPSGSPAASGSPAPSGSPAASQAPDASQAPGASDAPDASQAPDASDAPDASQAPDASDVPTPTQAPDDDDNNNGNNNSSKEPSKQTNATAKAQNGITVKANTKANGTATISTVKKTTKKSVTIASTITVGGVKYKVTTIGANAFKNCTKATKVTLPASITTINKNAFAGAKKLKTIKINSTKAVTVKKGAFKGLNTKKMTITVSKKMTKKQFNKMKKNLKNAGFKGKVKKA